MTQNQYRPACELKNAAKAYLAGRYGALIYALLTAMMATVPIAFIQSAIESCVHLLLRTAPVLFSNAVLHLLSAVPLALCGLLNIGILLLHLKIACGRTIVFSDLFYCFSNNQMRSAFGVAFGVNLPGIICTLPAAVFGWQFLQNPAPRIGVFALIAFAAGVLVCLPVSLALSMSYFLLLDFPEYESRKILALSRKLMKGNKGRLFLLEMSFLPLHVLGVLSMGIGYLWIEPYIHMTKTLFYLDVMEKQSSTAS